MSCDTVIHTWIFLLCVKFVPKFPIKTYQKAELLHMGVSKMDGENMWK